jgi:hypothetical protein
MEDTNRRKHTDAHPAELTGTEARQASPRAMNLRALIGGTLLAAVFGLGLLVWWVWL